MCVHSDILSLACLFVVVRLLVFQILCWVCKRLELSCYCMLVVHRVSRWARCSLRVRHLLQVDSTCRRCQDLITRTTCSRFVRSRDGQVSNKCVDLPSLEVECISIYCYVTHVLSGQHCWKYQLSEFYRLFLSLR